MRGTMAIAWGRADDSALFSVSDEVVDDVVCGSELADFFLHGVFEDRFLLLDQSALFFVV
jgi:hypothetical protein